MKYLLFAIIGLLLVMYLVQDRLIFFQPKISSFQRNALKQSQQQSFELEVDGATLKGWWVEPSPSSTSSQAPPKNQIILYFGGNAEEVSHNIPEFQRAFLSPSVFVNYRGYGDSSGKPSEKNFFSDALALFDEVKRQKPDHEVVIIGRSVGSGVATYLASQRTAHKLVLITPFDSMQSVAQNSFPVIPMGLLLKHKFRSDLYVEKLTAPTLILGASADEIIATKHTTKLIQCFSRQPEVVWIEGAGHNNLSGYAKYWTALSAFVNRDA